MQISCNVDFESIIFKYFHDVFSLFFQFQDLIRFLILLDHYLYITQLSGVQKFDLIAAKYSYQLIQIPLHR